jgi:hypothetical protein
MIVVNIWSTQKHKNFSFPFEGRKYNYQTRHWKGYFLFGFIPLLIVNTKTTYSL